MFGLIDHLGNEAKMKDGRPFRYSSHGLARLGKKYLESLRECVTVYRIREVTS